MTNELKADLSLLAITIVWGASFPIMSIALKDIPPYSFIAMRYTVAALILIITFRKRLKNTDKTVLTSGGLIGVALFLGTVLQTVGLKYTTPSKSGFITGLYVVLVPIIMAVVCKKIPDFKTILGVILSMLGLMLMSLNGRLGIGFGDFLTLLCALAFAVQIIFVDRFAKNIDVTLITFIEILTVSVLSIIPAASVEGFHMKLSVFSIGAVIFTSLFCTIIAYFVQNKMQPYTNPTHTAIIFLAEPVFSAIFSVLMGDKLSSKIFIGCVLILLGMLVINLDGIIMGMKKKTSF